MLGCIRGAHDAADVQEPSLFWELGGRVEAWEEDLMVVVPSD